MVLKLIDTKPVQTYCNKYLHKFCLYTPSRLIYYWIPPSQIILILLFWRVVIILNVLHDVSFDVGHAPWCAILPDVACIRFANRLWQVTHVGGSWFSEYWLCVILHHIVEWFSCHEHRRFTRSSLCHHSLSFSSFSSSLLPSIVGFDTELIHLCINFVSRNMNIYDRGVIY